MTRPGAGTREALVRRALADPSVLPSDLSIRFAVLMALIMASTGSIYGHLWLLSLPTGSRGATCLSVNDVQRLTGITPGLSTQFLGWTNDTLACEPRYAPGLAWCGIAGMAFVLLATCLGYRLMPRWRARYPTGFLRIVTGRARPMPLRPLVDYDRDAARAVADLAAEMGIAPVPDLLVSRVPGTSFVLGTGRRVVLCLDKFLVRRRRTDPVTFAAVVRHELAHVRNRDNRQTYLAIAAWRSFCLFAVLPYVGFGLAPVVLHGSTATLFTWENLHLTATVAALVVIVYVTWLAMLRARELQADATAGQFDAEHTFRAFLGQARGTARTWRPAFLRRHPSLDARYRAVEDPFTVARAQAGHLFAAGIAVSVLGADSTALVWYAFIASHVGGPMRLSVVRPDNALFLAAFAVVVVANLLSVGALAWLAAVSAWRAQLHALVRPTRPQTVVFSVAFAAGVLVGEPLSVTYADADVLGAFEGLRYGDGHGAVAAALFLVLVVATVYRWSWENAGAWLPVVRGSLRRACWATAAVSGIAVMLVYAGWWTAKDTPMVGDLYLWSPSLANTLTFEYWTAPGASWLLALYLPVDLAAGLPGEAALLLAPLLLLLLGLLRRDVTTPPDWLGALDAVSPPSGGQAVTAAEGRAVAAPAGQAVAALSRRGQGAVAPAACSPADVAAPPPSWLPRPRAATGQAVVVGLVCAGVAVVVSMLLAVRLHDQIGEAAIALNRSTALYYFARLNITIMTALAVVSASIVVLRSLAVGSSTVGASMAVLAATVTTGCSALCAPAAMLVGICGPAQALRCTGTGSARAYSSLYGVVGVRLFATSSIITAAAVAVILLGRHVWRSLSPDGPRRPLPRKQPLPQEQPPPQRRRARTSPTATGAGGPVLVWTVGLFIVTSLVVTA